MNPSLWNDEQEKPIQHIRIVDFSVMLPGPYLTRILAQYGADVIKVENAPHGDPLRTAQQTSLFSLMNQGKRSVALDLNQDEGRELVRKLAGEADVFVENFREGILDQMGLGYADLSEENPDLIYLSLRGFSGKNSVHAGHDLNFIANSGCGEWWLEGGNPNYSAAIGDIVGGTLVPAMKLLLHLSNPARRGMHIVNAMDEAVRTLFLPRAADMFAAEGIKESDRKDFGMHKKTNGSEPHTRYYKCRDGQWVALNAIQKKHWDTFCEVVDREAWKSRHEDPTLVADVDHLFLDAPSTYWEALAQSRELCLVRVIPWGEHVSFTQARPQLATDPLTWCGFAPYPGLKAAPELGEDTFSVLHSLGISNKQIGEWIKGGIAFQKDNILKEAAGR